MPKFQFGEGGILGKSKLKSLKVPRYALISIFRRVVFWASQNSKVPKCQDMPKCQFWGWGYSRQVKTQKVPKCQDMPKFQFSGGWYSGQVKTQKSQSAKICLNVNLGGGYSRQVKTQKSQSAKICLNFNLGGGILGKSKLKSPKVPRYP